MQVLSQIPIGPHVILSYPGAVRNGRENPDGDYGPVTEKAVKISQRLYGFKPDGEIEADTWTAQFDIIKQGVVSK